MLLIGRLWESRFTEQLVQLLVFIIALLQITLMNLTMRCFSITYLTNWFSSNWRMTWFFVFVACHSLLLLSLNSSHKVFISQLTSYLIMLLPLRMDNSSVWANASQLDSSIEALLRAIVVGTKIACWAKACIFQRFFCSEILRRRMHFWWLHVVRIVLDLTVCAVEGAQLFEVITCVIV